MRTRLALIAATVTAVLAVMGVGPAPALEVGQKAPEFSLNGPDGKPVTLSDLTANGPVVLYTFVAAFTPT